LAIVSLFQNYYKGNYFNYKAIIPKEFITKIEVNVNEFREIIERNMLVSDDGRKAPLILEINENIIDSKYTRRSRKCNRNPLY
jgi:DNA polymerase III sliding clamp (beta) subunit (PCNA family)